MSLERRRQSPLFPDPLQGYTSEVALDAGARVEAKLSGADGASATARVVRLRHGDPAPEGPGYREHAVAWGAARRIALESRALDLGARLEIPDAPHLSPEGDLTVALWVRPTLLRGWHALAAKWRPGGVSYGLFYAGEGFVTGAVSHDGRRVSWATASGTLAYDAWQLVALVYDAARGSLRVGHLAPDGRRARPRLIAKRVEGGRLHAGDAALMLGAIPDPSGAPTHWGHFNGKLARPLLFGAALDESALVALAGGADPDELGPVLGAWDLGRESSGTRLPDRSRFAHDGRAVNAPARAVTGPDWAGVAASLATSDPSQYDAVHLHDDDLDDAGWPTTVAFDVPTDAVSGIHAVRVATDDEEIFLPFVVRPASPAADVALLVPTLTWQAYGSNRLSYQHTDDGVLDASVSIYDAHSDGSIVYYASRWRPNRSWNPRAGFPNDGAHGLTADLYLVDWLEAQGVAADTLADQHLHQGGVAALEPYRCVLLSSHPEYWTERMLGALEGYLQRGGRVIYLGGNGLYWVTSIDAERPHLIEVRKSGEGLDVIPWRRPNDGEYQHSTTGEAGGYWIRRGRPPRDLVGVEYAGTMFEDGAGTIAFERLPASYEPVYAFVFDGVDADRFGDFGLNLGTGAGVELDAVPDVPWGDRPRPARLARAQHPLMTPPWRRPVPAAADLALTVRPNGAAVFAAGAVSWTGSLSHDDYRNAVSRITANVLRRFLERPPGESVLDDDARRPAAGSE